MLSLAGILIRSPLMSSDTETGPPVSPQSSLHDFGPQGIWPHPETSRLSGRERGAPGTQRAEARRAADLAVLPNCLRRQQQPQVWGTAAAEATASAPRRPAPAAPTAPHTPGRPQGPRAPANGPAILGSYFFRLLTFLRTFGFKRTSGTLESQFRVNTCQHHRTHQLSQQLSPPLCT